MKIAKAWVRCWWYCLWRMWQPDPPRMTSYHVRDNDGPSECHAIAATKKGWKVDRVFFESGPGVAARAFANYADFP